MHHCKEASFALDVGQMSGIVDTDSGSHIILRLNPERGADVALSCPLRDSVRG